MRLKTKNKIEHTFLNLIKFVLYLFFGFIIFNFTFILILLILISLASTNEMTNLPYIHKNYLGMINRVQMAYHVESSNFMDDPDDLLEFWDEDYIKENYSNNYHYFIEVKNNIAFTYAIPKKKYDTKKFLGINLGKDKKKPFYSYVGATFMTDTNSETKYNYKIDDIVCQNKEIGILKPNHPILGENSLLCGEHTKQIEGRG